MSQTNQKVYIRADATQELGYGHFIRCIVLAEILNQRFDVTFFTIDPSLYQIDILNRTCNYISLSYKDYDNEFINCLTGKEIVVLDKYFFNDNYQKRIKNKGCKLVTFAALSNQNLDSDIVINCWGVTKNFFHLKQDCQFFSGLDWAPIRKEFFSKEPFHTKEQKITICFGGSDPNNLTERTISIIEQLNFAGRIVAVVGDGHRLGNFNFSNKVVYRKNLNAKEMSLLLHSSEYAIVPASTTLIEALICGCKIISGYYVDNQKLAYNSMLDRRYIIGIDNFNDGMYDAKIIYTLRNIKELSQNLNSYTGTYSKLKNNYIETFKSLM